ncbi:CDP-glucose 4,6-dehydratase [Ferruginibacter lapsinanis]|uniref:CDP-glucose 4,6-dehydratase n=1 Tax=Ferruginibacter lapsinanis TaxID=563172 RepID=UPI001E4C0AA4|nr:CDP-glucose 4,6-dehydratase [Ferruginibacter lapsinanis]UEG49047.1 CDP-glucose 4,6-dehydratase [Ferruginibacter lapsinanis]
MESVVNKISSFYTNKRVFVTGHTGFKGAWLITWLRLMGADVKGYSLPPEDSNGLYNIVSKNIEFENVFADIRDAKRLSAEIENFQPDIIFHLAAQALVRRSYEIPSETFDVNVVGTANVLEAVKNKLPKKCTVVLITTDKVYENRELDYHYKEEDRLGGYDPYSASKAAAEIVISSFRNSFFNIKQYSLHQKAIISTRAGNVIGGGDWSKDRIIPDIVRALQQNKTIEVRNPASVRPWQHVLEPLAGYLTVAMLANENYKTVSEAYNFGPLPVDHLAVKELVEVAIKSWGSGEWADTSNAAQPHEAGLLKLDISKALKELKWQPKLSSSEAIEWTMTWYKQTEENVFQFTQQQINNYLSK